jgi:hypothetical protein
MDIPVGSSPSSSALKRRSSIPTDKPLSGTGSKESPSSNQTSNTSPSLALKIRGSSPSSQRDAKDVINSGSKKVPLRGNGTVKPLFEGLKFLLSGIYLITPLLHLYYILITFLLYPYYILITPLLHSYCTLIIPLLHPYTLITPLLHSYYSLITPLLHPYYTLIISLLEIRTVRKIQFTLNYKIFTKIHRGINIDQHSKPRKNMHVYIYKYVCISYIQVILMVIEIIWNQRSKKQVGGKLWLFIVLFCYIHIFHYLYIDSLMPFLHFCVGLCIL